MNALRFCYYMDYDNGKMARMQTTVDLEIPVNIFADDGSDFALAEGTICNIEVWGYGIDIEVFKTEEEFISSGNFMASISMIPTGTFSPKEEGNSDFQENPQIMFVGNVTDVEINPQAKPDENNYCLTINTLEMTINVFMRYDGIVEIGNVVYGTAWLYADIAGNKSSRV